MVRRVQSGSMSLAPGNTPKWFHRGDWSIAYKATEDEFHARTGEVVAAQAFDLRPSGYLFSC
jgi:hypothetical protein